ncbi:hypothetical protein F900_00524 [Acinetobacter modestus]|uniref:NADH:flavin oxidoreductase/NADH oxidase N-terminal domain-containing protein n=1 Tax=Acinetobacter modestus TaxID=1776740 RepID=N9M678_9GAMM|nr:hypothetical protein F900_00524 [Acinetobacter modestus]
MTDLPLKTNLLNQSLTLPNDFVIPNRLAISNNSIVLPRVVIQSPMKVAYGYLSN